MMNWLCSIAAGRTLILDTKRRIVVGFAPATCAALFMQFRNIKLKQLLWGEASVNPNQLTIEGVQEILLKEKYVCDRALATVVYLSLVMGKPLLLEGEAGVGKTEIAKVLAKVLGTKLIRLQCYEGLDANTALYEWNYPKQMLRIKLEEVEHGDKQKVETEIFSQDYLIKRPLLEAIQ